MISFYFFKKLHSFLEILEKNQCVVFFGEKDNSFDVIERGVIYVRVFYRKSDLEKIRALFNGFCQDNFKFVELISIHDNILKFKWTFGRIDG